MQSSLIWAFLLTFFIYLHPHPTQKFNHFQYGVRLVPHPQKVHKGGEDAFFVNDNVLAVADGVGSWNSKGVDPSKYSKEFCSLIGVLLHENYTNYINNPKALIQEAAKRNINNGTSTIVIANLDKTRPILRTSYVGDSIYIIYRKQEGTWKAIFEAAVHQVKFNSPYQLGYKRGAPSKALEFVHEVQDKDIVVVGSDGIFDNLTSDQILAELIKFIGTNDELKDAQEAAHNITEVAYKLSLNRNYMSPFRIKATSANYTSTAAKGGKSDDITTVVGQIRIVSNSKNIIQE